MAKMDKEQLLLEMREACEHVGYKIRFERGDFNGGACILHEERLLVINKRSTIEKKLATIAGVLADVGVDSVFLKPAVRAYIEDELAKASQ